VLRCIIFAVIKELLNTSLLHLSQNRAIVKEFCDVDNSNNLMRKIHEFKNHLRIYELIEMLHSERARKHRSINEVDDDFGYNLSDMQTLRCHLFHLATNATKDSIIPISVQNCLEENLIGGQIVPHSRSVLFAMRRTASVRIMTHECTRPISKYAPVFPFLIGSTS
jgi:hypothetical protein